METSRFQHLIKCTAGITIRARKENQLILSFLNGSQCRHATNVVLKDNQAQFKYNEHVLNDMVTYLSSNGIKTNKTAVYNKIRLICLDFTLAWAVQDRRQTYDLDLGADETVEDRVRLLCRDYYILEGIFNPPAEKQHPETPKHLAAKIKQEPMPRESKHKGKVPRNMSVRYALLKQAGVFFDEGIFEKEEYDRKRLLILEDTLNKSGVLRVEKATGFLVTNEALLIKSSESD